MKSVLKLSLPFLAVFCLAIPPAIAEAGGDGGTALAAEKRGVVEVRIYRDATPLAAGCVGLIVSLRVNKGWHINSHAPRDEFLIPTSVALAENPHWKIDRVSYPEGEEIGLSFSDQPVSVYEGTVEIPVELKPAGTVTPAREEITILIDFQPCNSNSCVAPETVELTVLIGAEAEGGKQ